jgi:ABC-2 type transport system permease protein
MKNFLRFAGVIARRDFLAVVGSPTFFMFLLTPLIMIVMSTLLGSSIASGMERGQQVNRVAAILSAQDAPLFVASDRRIRASGGVGDRAAINVFVTDGQDAAKVRALFEDPKTDYNAVLSGPLEHPLIQHEASSAREAAYLAEIAEQALRSKKAGISADTPLSKAKMQSLKPTRSGAGSRLQLASSTVFLIFMLILMLAGQAVGMLAEEKSNKVIEILAAAAPLESVFFGKLVGMFGVAMLFVIFWLGMGGGAIALFAKGNILSSLDPAIGLAKFIPLCALYFAMAYMLLGAVFLGLGALAATMRELQMMSLPITIFQMGMFALASRGAGDPGSRIARIAEWVPFSSPFAMAAHGATDAALWPHIVALLWQALWVGITIWVSARLFRVGVLKSGNWRTAFRFGKAATNG